MRVRALIFDLDGTLVDSLRDITDALNAARAGQKMEILSAAQVKDWIGDGLPTLCRRACPSLDDARLKKIISSAAQHYANHCVRYTRAYPNILQMLSLLRDRNIPMAILSNKPHPLTVAVVEQLSLSHYFNCVTGARHEIDRKPSPKVPREIAGILGADPAEICIVGDSEVDILTARNAGMTVASAAWGFRGEKNLREAGPDWLLNDPLEVLDLPFEGSSDSPQV